MDDRKTPPWLRWLVVIGSALVTIAGFADKTLSFYEKWSARLAGASQEDAENAAKRMHEWWSTVPVLGQEWISLSLGLVGFVGLVWGLSAPIITLMRSRRALSRQRQIVAQGVPISPFPITKDTFKIDFDWDDAPDVCLEGETALKTETPSAAETIVRLKDGRTFDLSRPIAWGSVQESATDLNGLQSQFDRLYDEWVALDSDTATRGELKPVVLSFFLDRFCPWSANVTHSVGPSAFANIPSPEILVTAPEICERITGTPDTCEGARRIVFWAAACHEPGSFNRSAHGFPPAVKKWAEEWIVDDKRNMSESAAIENTPGARTICQPLDWVRAFIERLETAKRAEETFEYPALDDDNQGTVGVVEKEAEPTTIRNQGLAIIYNKDAHYTPDPSGAVQVRVVVQNLSAQRVRLSDVKIVDLVPLTNKKKSQAYSSQFSGTPLKIVRGQIGMALDSKNLVEVLIAHAAKGDQWIWFDSSDPNGPFKVPAASEYRVRIVAVGKTEGSDEKCFRIRMNRAGILVFDPIPCERQ